MESNRAPRTMFDTLLENCIFYISRMYEFSHSQGQQANEAGRVSARHEAVAVVLDLVDPVRAGRRSVGAGREAGFDEAGRSCLAGA